MTINICSVQGGREGSKYSKYLSMYNVYPLEIDGKYPKNVGDALSLSLFYRCAAPTCQFFEGEWID